MIIGGGIAAVLMYGTAGRSVDLPNNGRVSVATTSTPATRATPRELTITPSPTPSQPQRTLILNQLFSVPAGRTQQFTFHLPTRARVQGRFTISGGFGNDIDVVLADYSQHYYDSRATSVGGVDVLLEAGDYRLIFDNSYAKVFGKRVSATFYAFH